MFHTLRHAFFHTLEDVWKAVPILLLVYTILYWIENRLRSTPTLLEKSAEFGPIVGALAGSIPQCGFSAAASALFIDGYLAPATLVAVFLATSDEAFPILLSDGASSKEILFLFGFKFILAIVGGYLLKLLWGQKKNSNHQIALEHVEDGCGCGCNGPWRGILGRTLRTATFLLLIGILIHLVMDFVGTDRLSEWMLKDSILQPIICAAIGLIPSCAISVLLTQLYTSGVIGMGSLIAGLSTGAGFGYMILLGSAQGRKRAIPIIFATLCLAITGGILGYWIFD